MQPTPDVPEIPEPGTLVLFGLGIGAMIARRRMAAGKEKD
ncbi:MAG: PEP-CTERM sorting domain-containing protein [Blastocatellia bacterium]